MADTSKHDMQWINTFKQAHGRPPKVLHIGNIANNAYLNAKMLNRIGFECDVICKDYLHIMSCPEWEDADFEDVIEDEYAPKWYSIDLKGFQRPSWFIQGPTDLCVKYLFSRYFQNQRHRESLWHQLRLENHTEECIGKPASIIRQSILKNSKIGGVIQRFFKFLLYEKEIVAALDSAFSFLIWDTGFLGKFGEIIKWILFLPSLVALIVSRIIHGIFKFVHYLMTRNDMLYRADHQLSFLNGLEGIAPIIKSVVFLSIVIPTVCVKTVSFPFKLMLFLIRRRIDKANSFSANSRIPLTDKIKKRVLSERIKFLAEKFQQLFPERGDKIKKKDFVHYDFRHELWQPILKQYDLVHAYALDGIIPLFADIPYAAYEHGTIRAIPFEATSQGRLCALTYSMANHVLITNCDNILAAEKLNLKNITFVPHPVNEDFLEPDQAAWVLQKFLYESLNCNFIVFHPSRHHWEEQRHPSWEKGNDILIRGFASFLKKINPRALAIFVEWGSFVHASKKLLKELGVAHRVLWIPPQPNRQMFRYIHACDLLADQFYLGAFGSTMPKALASRKPAMLYLNEEVHRWCFKEMPPVINTKTPEDVFQGLKKLYEDSDWREKLSSEGQVWYQEYHSNQVIASTLSHVYKQIWENRKIGE